MRNKVNKKYIGLSLAVILWILPQLEGYSQEINLLIELAKKQNIEITNAQRKVEIAKILSTTHKVLDKTPVELQLGNIQNPGINDYSLIVSQKMSLPKVYETKKDILQQLLKDEEINQNITTKDLIFKINELYTEISYRYVLDSLFNSEIENLKRILVISEKRFETGESDALDKTRIALKISELENRSISNSTEINNFFLDLQILTGGNLPNNLTFKELPKLFGMFDTLKENVFLRKYESAVKINQFENEHLKARLLPDLNFGLINQSMLGRKDQFVAIAGLEIPIWNKSQKKTLEAGKINGMILNDDLKRLELELSAKNQKLHQLYNTTINLQQRLQTDLDSYLVKTYQLIEKQYINGQTDYLEWYNVSNQIINKKIEIQQTQKQLNQIIINLNYLNSNE